MNYNGPLSISCSVSRALPASEPSFNAFVFFSATLFSFFSAAGAGGICATQNFGYCLCRFIRSTALTSTTDELSSNTGR